MPNGNSPYNQIVLMAENDTLKYLLNNDGFVAMDQAFNRILQVNMTSGNVTLTQSQFTRNITFQCTGHTVPRTLTVPSTVGSAPVVTVNRFFIVINGGTADVTIDGGAGANVICGSGSAVMVVSDGSAVYLISRYVPAREYREEGVNQVTDPTFVNFIGNGVLAASSASGVNVTVTLPTVQKGGVNQTTDTTNINFTGNGVTVTPTGSSAAVNIPGVNVSEEGVVQTTGAAEIDFLGATVTVVNNAGTAEVTVASPTVQEEGVTAKADPTFINFVGTGVLATANGSGVDVTIPAITPISISTESTSRNLANADFVGDKMLLSSAASTITFTVPSGLTGTEPVTIAQGAAGQVVIAAGGGVTINSADGYLKARVQWSSMTLIPTATDTYLLVGDLAA